MADDQQRLVATIEARFTKFERDMQRVVGVSERRMSQVERGITRAMERAERSTAKAVSGMERSLSRVGKAMMIGGGVGGSALLGRQLLRLADDWTRAGNKIAAGDTPLDQVEGKLQLLADLANRSRSGINETVDLYARLGRAKDQLGASDADILRVTETVNKALKTGGATAAEAASAVLQLGQALGSGLLQGDELRAIRENSQVLAQAIADEFGVTIGDLKKLGEEGQLTSDRVFKAILKASSGVDEAFSRTKATMSDAGTLFWNEMTRFIAAAEKEWGVAKMLGEVIMAVARNTDLLAGATTMLAAVLAGRLVVGGIARAAQALTLYVAGLRTATAWSVQLGTASTRAGALAGGLGAGLLRFFGGPIGLLITGVGAAVGMYTASLDDAAQSAAEYEATTSQIIGGLEMVARMQDEAAKSAKGLAGDIAEAAKAQEDAKKISEALAATRREEAIATLSAAQAAAYLRMQNAQTQLAAGKARLAELSPMVPEDPYDTSGKFDPAHRDEYNRIAEGLGRIGEEAKTAEEAATLMWNALQKLLSGELTVPESGSGRGTAGGIANISKELEKLMELEAKRRNWRSDPENKYDARQTLEDASDRVTADLPVAPGSAKDRQTAAAREAQMAWRDVFRGFIYDLQSGDIKGALLGIFDAVTARMMERASDWFADAIYDAVGPETMTALFGPAEAAQAAMASATTSATTAQVANTTALAAATTALYNFAAAAAASAGGSGGGILANLFGGGSGGGGLAAMLARITGFGGTRAAGGPVLAGRSYLVGEQGPELVNFGRTGTVIPARATRNIMNSAREAAVMQSNFTYAPQIYAPNSDAAALARLEGVVMRQGAEFRAYQRTSRGRAREDVAQLSERRAFRK